MGRQIAVLMDAPDSLNIQKDTTLALIAAFWAQGDVVSIFDYADMSWRADQLEVRVTPLQPALLDAQWYQPLPVEVKPVTDFDLILMRKDPPFDMPYVYATYWLEAVECAGVVVLNRPSAIRDWNEKCAILAFPDLLAPTLVSADQRAVRAFIADHEDVILKPLNGMGGQNIFRVRCDDPNITVILSLLMSSAQRFVMAQAYIPEISSGDKRILMINGQAVDYALSRKAAAGETRANLAAGGRGEVVPLTMRDRLICERVGPILRDRGLFFVGLDVIGDYLTEINVTSPTCLREIADGSGDDLAARVAAQMSELLGE